MVYCKGEIKFITRSERNREPAKFVLVTGENDPRRAAEKVLRIMLDEWKIPKPELVIAVAGGSRRFRVSDEHRQIFIDGLNRLTQATCESWLLTAGTDMGVVNVVGDAMKRVSVKARHKVHCIGIASWHEVDGRENIIDTETEERRLSMSAKGGNDISDDEATETTLLATPGSSPARRESRPFKKESAALAQSQLLLSKTFYSSTYTVLPIKSSGPIPINPFHTHFVFVSRKDKDDEERFRVKLRVELQKLLTTGAAPASGVLIQMEGGIDTTRAVRNALKRRIPVVLCEGTGRAADYLSYACRHCENIDQVTKDKYSGGYFEKMVEVAHDGESPDEQRRHLAELLGYISDIIEGKDLVEVYDADQLNENAGFDFAVLQALLRARGASREYFYLAFNWNRGDIAKEMMSLNNLALSTGDKEELMSRALSEKENRVTFVRLLLDHGLVLNDYLTNFRLDQLYHWHASKSSLALDVEIRNSCPSYRRSVNEELKSMMRGYYTPSNVEEKYEKRPFRELFIWALLVNRYELASFFWTRCADPISLAIVACRVYKCIASKGFADPDDEALCLTLADEYEDKACNVLAETRALDDDYALQLVERRLPLLGNLNMLELGALADCKRFVGHASCQRSLDNRWDGDMKYPFTHKVLLPVLFPPAIFCTVKFKHEHSCLGKINAFYSAPMTKFVFDWVALLCFLILYSHVSLYMDRYPFKTQDYILHVWVLTMLLEEIRQIFIPRDEHESVWQRFTNYWRSIWNVLDTFAIICVAVGFGIRFYDNDTAFSVSRALYAIGCVIFWIRMLRMYLFSKNLGPFLIMIKGMLREMYWFLLVLMVFIVGFGVAAQIILYTGRDPYRGILRDIFYMPYFQIYGELFLEVMNTTNELDIPVPDTFSSITYTILLALYLLIGNVLLLNILIAIFSRVYERVEANSLVEWRYERYSLISEYEDRPAIPPPFIIVVHIYRTVRWCLLKCTACSSCKKQPATSEINMTSSGTSEVGEYDRLMKAIERESLDNYRRRQADEQRSSAESRMNRIEERCKIIMKKMEQFEERLKQSPTVTKL